MHQLQIMQLSPCQTFNNLGAVFCRRVLVSMQIQCLAVKFSKTSAQRTGPLGGFSYSSASVHCGYADVAARR